MRSVGMGAMPDNEEDKRLLAEITELKAKKSTRKGKTDSAAEDHAAE